MNVVASNDDDDVMLCTNACLSQLFYYNVVLVFISFFRLVSSPPQEIHVQLQNRKFSRKKIYIYMFVFFPNQRLTNLFSVGDYNRMVGTGMPSTELVVTFRSGPSV